MQIVGDHTQFGPLAEGIVGGRSALEEIEKYFFPDWSGRPKPVYITAHNPSLLMI
jgi:hypothetical protein